VITPEPVITPNPVTTSPTGVSDTSKAGILQFAATTYMAEESEGELHKIVVNRTGGNLGEVSVQYLTTVASTATYAIDFTGGNGMLTWASGDMKAKSVTLTLLKDNKSESLETVNIILSNPSGQAILGRQTQTTLVITDNMPVMEPITAEEQSVKNSTPGILQFSAPFYTMNEDIGNLTTFMVTRGEGSSGEVSVQYIFTDEGTAVRNHDYVGGKGTLSWADGDNLPKPISLMVLDDSQTEDLETIPLVLFEPTGNAKLGTVNEASLIIVDNDNKQSEVLTSPQEETELTSSQEESTSSTSNGKSSIASPAAASEYALPSLGRAMAVTKDGSMFNADALKNMTGLTVAFRGGASVNKQPYQATLATTPSKMVNIFGEIDIAEAHIGQEADILVVAGVLNDVSEAISQFLMLDSQEQLQVWDGEFVTLVGSKENVILSTTQVVNIYHGLIGPVRAQIYFGYRLKENGSIYFNGEQPIEVQVTDDHEGNDDNNPQDQKVVWHSEFSPNGEQIVVASSTGHVSLWDANSGQRLAKLTGHTKKVKSAIFSADSKWLVTSSHDRTARLWNIETKQDVMVLSGHERALEYATFSPNGQRIITASADKTARIWDVANGETLLVLGDHEQGVQYATFSHDGKQVATASWDHTARLWDAETGEEIAVLAGHEDMVEHATFSPDNQYVVTTSLDKTARVWDAETGLERFILEGHRSGVAYAAFSPDGEYIVTTSWDTSARLWDAKSGESLWERKHLAGVHHAAFSPKGQLIVTGSNDGTARLWETATGKPIKTLKGHEGNVWQVGFSPDGKRVISASWDNTVRVWEIESGSVVMVLKD